MAIGKAGDDIICENGHVCGTLHIDVNADDKIELPESRRSPDSPFSVDLYITVEDRPGGHVCKTCGAPVTRTQNETWQVRTRQGWVGRLA